MTLLDCRFKDFLFIEDIEERNKLIQEAKDFIIQLYNEHISKSDKTTTTPPNSASKTKTHQSQLISP